ncbi:WxL domain-containing protein [Levilactobacillus tangyuanensis]|uniref:WxL domain-containing protein n=1 Tax=Levilactobacillus tangyuanensis TaxID=2486021 RepID=A0ABW1TL51_9LACO|nr:WxL domain-containing protein [Levilactobacillus tangyuanensis]
MKRFILILGIIGGCLWNGVVTVSATDNGDLKQAIAAAPAGIPLDQLLTGSQVPKNSGRLIDSNTLEQTIGQLTHENAVGGEQQVGALWSFDGESSEQKTKLDLKKDKAISAWLYFGNRGSEAADGLTFVLHNSPAKMAAGSGGGQSLGAWGTNPDPTVTDPLKLAMTGIQNSWALEFDTHPNRLARAAVPDFFDGAAVVSEGMHVDSGYPGDPAEYQVNTHPEVQPALNFFNLATTRPQLTGNLADGRWHHLTLNWLSASSQVRYALNDRDPVTKQPLMTGAIMDTIVIDQKKLGIEAGKPASLYWGFTGATNPERSENGLVVIDKISGGPEFNTKRSVLRNEETNRTILPGTVVNPGTRLKYVYDLTYSGDAVLDGMKFDVPLPPEIEWDSGKLIQQNAKDITFSQQDLKEARLKTQLDKPLKNGDSNRVLVVLRGRVKQTGRHVKMANNPGSFYGPNYRQVINTPEFFINGKLDLKLENLGADTLKVKHHQPAVIKGRLTNGGEALTIEEWQHSQVNVILNGHELPNPAILAPKQDGEFQLTIPADQLNVGRNLVILRAKDNPGHPSNDLSVVVEKRAGQLTFSKVPKTTAFKSAKLTGQRQLVARQDDWQIGVQDDRGAGSTWKLTVQMSQAFANVAREQLAGELVYVNGKNQQRATANQSILVMENESQHDSEQTSVTKGWTDDTGLMLAIHSGAKAGNYAGRLTWQLENVPKS